jgi:hypothetical protein
MLWLEPGANVGRAAATNSEAPFAYAMRKKIGAAADGH